MYDETYNIEEISIPEEKLKFNIIQDKINILKEADPSQERINVQSIKLNETYVEKLKSMENKLINTN